MEITIERAPIEAKPVLWRLLQTYLHDLSEFDGSDPDDAGEYRYDYFNNYWDVDLYPHEPREPYFIRVDGKLAGFAMIRYMVNGKWQMAEFCVLRKWRGQGVALEAATRVLRYHPGPWDMTIHPKNERAKAFWVKAIEAVAVGEWQEKGGLFVWHIFEVAAGPVSG